MKNFCETCDNERVCNYTTKFENRSRVKEPICPEWYGWVDFSEEEPKIGSCVVYEFYSPSKPGIKVIGSCGCVERSNFKSSNFVYIRWKEIKL